MRERVFAISTAGSRCQSCGPGVQRQHCQASGPRRHQNQPAQVAQRDCGSGVTGANIDRTRDSGDSTRLLVRVNSWQAGAAGVSTSPARGVRASAPDTTRPRAPPPPGGGCRPPLPSGVARHLVRGGLPPTPPIRRWCRRSWPARPHLSQRRRRQVVAGVAARTAPTARRFGPALAVTAATAAAGRGQGRRIVP